MEKATTYVWQVSLGERHVTVTAPDKLAASKMAARELGVIWKETAGKMEFLKLRRA